MAARCGHGDNAILECISMKKKARAAIATESRNKKAAESGKATTSSQATFWETTTDPPMPPPSLDRPTETVSRKDGCTGPGMEDRSMVEGPDGKLISRREANGWGSPGAMGEYRLIHKRDLNIDPDYQRGEARPGKIRKIAAEFKWSQFGALDVIQRPDGKYFLYDGGHRHGAAFYRDDVEMLPCIVHRLEDVPQARHAAEEAKEFLAKNTNTTPVASLDRYRAMLKAGDEEAQIVEQVLLESDMAFSPHAAHSPGRIACVQRVLDLAKVDPDVLVASLLYCRSVCADNEPISQKVLTAVFELQRHFLPGINVLSLRAAKLKRESHSTLLREIRRFEAECDSRGAIIGAKALVRLLNKRVTHKLVWEDSQTPDGLGDA
jgi:hypothetical protein